MSMMINPTVVELSRLQFALTALYHFLFVPLTLGMTFILATMETVYVITGKQIYKEMTLFWGKLFGINAHSTPFGHSIHRHPATDSTMIRPLCPRPFGRGGRSVATWVKGRYADWADGVNRCFFRMDSPSIVSL